MKESCPFSENELLFGWDKTENIVAVECDGNEGVIVFLRTPDGKTKQTTDRFKPFIFFTDDSLIKKIKPNAEIIRLEGNRTFRYIVFLNSWKEADSFHKTLKKKTGFSSQSPDAPFYFISDPVNQYLLSSGKTLFKGMSFDDIVRMQLDIETFCDPSFEFSNPLRETDSITLIAISDNRGFEYAISGDDEKEMLNKMVEIISQRDPDIIEGHNINKFDLWYIEERAKKLGITLKLGRGGKNLSSHPSRISIAERIVSYPKYEIFGRHVIDTWLLAQLYDISYRGLASYGLKDIAKHFGVSPKNRTYLQPEKLSWYFKNDIDTLKKYAIDDVKETMAISEILSYPFFIQAQIFPFSFQNVTVKGNATRINSLFIREYLRKRHSIPAPQPGASFEGGYADIFHQGVLQNIVHCDVQSLYPSILLNFGYYPEADELGIFPALLSDLRDFRIEAKKLMKGAEDEKTKRYYDALQGTFKILINSFYGYLGFSLGHFSDFRMASKVTEKGREILTAMIRNIEKSGYIIAEIDTDGIYFSLPLGLGSFNEKNILDILSDGLPSGINVEIDGTYKAMFSYKIKNYVLLDNNGKISIKGSGLKSRGLELFQRKFMEEMFSLLLSGEKERIKVLYEGYREAFMNHSFSVEMFSKTETLTESTETYREKLADKKRNASAAYEIALKSERKYGPGDQITYYVTGNSKRVKVFSSSKPASMWDRANPDENVDYYIDKLDALYEKFKPFTE